jgi:hypothetical protein
MLLSPPRSKRAKVTRSRVSAANKPYPQLASKLLFLPTQPRTHTEAQLVDQPANLRRARDLVLPRPPNGGLALQSYE